MALFTWNSTYSVGNPKMDDHHKELFNIINKVHEDIIAKKGTAALNQRITDLLNYTRYHFSAEEEQMKKINYPGYPEQKKAHDAFINQILTYQKDLNSGKELLVTTNITNSLITWLTSHVAQVDKKYKGQF